MAVTAAAPVKGSGLAELYNGRIKQLAARVLDDRLEAGETSADGQPVSAILDNPLCGDEVEVTVWVEKERIRRLSVSVRGCLLCQAAAAAMVDLALETPAASLHAHIADLEAFLAGKTNGLEPAWARELACFAPLQAFPGRRGCVLLPFQALSRSLGPDQSQAGA